MGTKRPNPTGETDALGRSIRHADPTAASGDLDASIDAAVAAVDLDAAIDDPTLRRSFAFIAANQEWWGDLDLDDMASDVAAAVDTAIADLPNDQQRAFREALVQRCVDRYRHEPRTEPIPGDGSMPDGTPPFRALIAGDPAAAGPNGYADAVIEHSEAFLAGEHPHGVNGYFETLTRHLHAAGSRSPS